MRYLPSLALLVLVACQNDLTLPQMEPTDESAAIAYWAPLYPDAVTCPAGTNGAFKVILHGENWQGISSYAALDYDKTDVSAERRVEAEVYSYTASGQLCRNTGELITWARVNWNDNRQHHTLQGTGNASYWQYVTYYAPSEPFPSFQTGHGPMGQDRLIAQVGPKQVCGAICPSYPGGIVADSIYLQVYYAGLVN